MGSPMTPNQAIAAVVAKARSQVGVNYTSSWSKYGAWYHPNYARALWCAMGISWTFFHALGRSATIALLGQQMKPWSIGHAWTVSMYRHLLATGTRVSWNNAQPGDLIFFRFPGNSRSTNPTNHVDLVISKTGSNGRITTIGFNTPRPGTSGDPSAGRGVWIHSRNQYAVVAVLRPAYSKVFKAAASKPTAKYTTRRIPVGMRPGKKAFLINVIQDTLQRPQTGVLNAGDVAATKRLQKSLGLKQDGFYGPATGRGYIKSKSPKNKNYTLREGARGDYVRLIQYCCGMPFDQCDGIWGANTTAWVKKAQSHHGLKADAIFGEQSRSKIIR